MNDKMLKSSEWNLYHPWPSYNTVRALVSKARKRGFDLNIIKIKNTIYFSEFRFLEYLKHLSNNPQAKEKIRMKNTRKNMNLKVF
jgi:hypothetical protein